MLHMYRVCKMGVTRKRPCSHAMIFARELAPARTRWNRSKQEKLQLTVTSAFQRIKELSFDVCHEKAKCMLGLHARFLFGRLERAMAINVIFQICKVNINA